MYFKQKIYPTVFVLSAWNRKPRFEGDDKAGSKSVEINSIKLAKGISNQNIIQSNNNLFGVCSSCVKNCIQEENKKSNQVFKKYYSVIQ